jgi:hypothetical protein
VTPALDPHLDALAKASLRSFGDWEKHKSDVPTRAWGVYTVWAAHDRLMYVGMGGTTRSSDEGAGLISRLSSHASGQRSGNRFCIYVCDRLVLKSLRPDEIDEVATGRLSLDGRTRDVIRGHLGFRLVSVPDARTALDLENGSRAAPSAGDRPCSSRLGRRPTKLRIGLCVVAARLRRGEGHPAG